MPDDELLAILDTMDLPSKRIRPLDIRWLIRNIHFRNYFHTRYEVVWEELKRRHRLELK